MKLVSQVRPPWERRTDYDSVTVSICRANNTLSQLLAKDTWPATGKYEFTRWAGPAAFHRVLQPTPKATADSPILIIIPGVKRNAEEYRNEWDHLATANRFITLVVEATKKLFPTEYEYNVGGVINARGEVQPENRWLFSAIDPVFDDFKKRFGSHQDRVQSFMATRRAAVLCTSSCCSNPKRR